MVSGTARLFIQIVITTFPVSEPAPFRVFSSRNRSASTAAAKGKTRPTSGFKVPSSTQANHLGGAMALFLGRGVEHREAEDRAVPRIEGTQGQGGLGGAAGHQDHPAVLAEQGDGDLEVGLALGLVPDVDSFRGEFAEPRGDVVGLVVESQVGPQFAAELDSLGLPAEVATRAPAALAIWTTIEPTPPEPPGT